LARDRLTKLRELEARIDFDAREACGGPDGAR
jgi:hypothetical protein